MTYTTPELLTVGSASDLVLTPDISEVGGPDCDINPTDTIGVLSDYIENW